MSNHEPFLVDVLLSSYQGSLFIDEQIASILAQKGVQVHLWLRDDGSTDGTKEKLLAWQKKEPKRITLLEGGVNVGILASYSLLAEKSSAPFVAFADQDDVWHQEKLITLVRLAKPFSTQPVLVHADLTVVNKDLEPMASSFWEKMGLQHTEKELRLSVLLGQPLVTGCACLVNRALMELAFPLPEVALMHDHWMSLVAAAFGTIISCPRQLVQYRQHTQNVIGARPLSWSNWKNKLRSYPLQEERKEIQAKAFLTHFKEMFTNEQTLCIEAFLQKNQKSFLKRIVILKKYKISKIGWKRKLFEIYLSTLFRKLVALRAKKEEFVWKPTLLQENLKQECSLVLFSYHRPLQLQALLESMQLHGVEATEVVVLYRADTPEYRNAYRSLLQRFQNVTGIEQESRHSFKEQLLAKLKTARDYICFGVDDMIVKEPFHFSRCLQALEDLKGYGFFLRLGKNINYCYNIDSPLKRPALRTHHDILSWSFSGEKGEWNYPHNVDMTIYRTKDVLPLLTTLTFTHPNSLEEEWSKFVPEKAKGLCFPLSKVFNIPMNVVHASTNRYAMHYSTKKLLQHFQAGKRLSVESLKHYPNHSCHADVLVDIV